MKRCEPIQEGLKAFVDGELSLQNRITVSWHLLSCKACQEECNEMRKVSSIMNATIDPLADSLRKRILGSAPVVDGTAANTKYVKRQTNLKYVKIIEYLFP